VQGKAQRREMRPRRAEQRLPQEGATPKRPHLEGERQIIRNIVVNQDTDHLSDYAKAGRAAPDDRKNDVGHSPTY
jgi:hypothetical protein